MVYATDGYSLARKMFPYLAGQRADTYPKATSTVYCDTEVPFGVALVADPSDFNKVMLPSPSNANFLGISEHQHLDPYEAFVGDTTTGQFSRTAFIGYPRKYPINLATAGHWVVLLDDDVTSISATDPVMVRVTASGETKKPGQFRKDAAGGQAMPWAKARWIDVAGISQQLAVIEFNYGTP